MVLHSYCRGRLLGDPSGEAAHLRMEQSRALNGTSSRNCTLASPGGKLPGLTALRNRQGWLMRGGDRLVNECSQMIVICSGFLHLTGKSETFSYRRPSSASLRSAAFPRGKPRGGSDGCFHIMHPVVPEAAGRQVGDPYSGGEAPRQRAAKPPLLVLWKTQVLRTRGKKAAQ